ncbi:MAG: hypothetical protein HY782_06770 [Chloroflexi bacterium]|nr:hypothetical protein [Chloroflexota bacterium]
MREEVVREVITRFMTEPDYLDAFKSYGAERIVSRYQLTRDEMEALKNMAPKEMGLGKLDTRISASTVKGIEASGCPCLCPNTSNACKGC